MLNKDNKAEVIYDNYDNMKKTTVTKWFEINNK